MQNFIIVTKNPNERFIGIYKNKNPNERFIGIYKNKLFENEIAAALEKEKAILQDKQSGDKYEYEIVPVWKPDEETINTDLMLLIEKQIRESVRLEFDLIHSKLDQLIADMICIRKHFSEKLIKQEK